jgi:hypothetical protein
LCETLGHKSSFISFNITRSIPFGFVNPFAAYGYSFIW